MASVSLASRRGILTRRSWHGCSANPIPSGQSAASTASRFPSARHGGQLTGCRNAHGAIAGRRGRHARSWPGWSPRATPTRRSADATAGAAKTVAKWRTDLGLHKQQQARPSKPSREALARLVSQGRSDRVIGQHYQVAPITVRMWRYDYGGLLRRESPSPRPSPEELARLVGQGHSDQEIGQRYQVTAATVARWRKADGLRRERRPAVDPAKVLELRHRGLTATMIAAELGCSPPHVYRVASRSRRTRQPANQPSASASPDQPGRPASNASNGDLPTPPVVDGDSRDPAAALAELAQDRKIPLPDGLHAATATREQAG